MGQFSITKDQLNTLDGGTPGSSVQACPLRDGSGVFKVNRQLAPVQKLSGNATPDPLRNAQVLSHTFVYTTDENGDLEHTYSWGNDYTADNPSHWYKDRPEDVAAAMDAIQNRKAGPSISGLLDYGTQVGGKDKVPYVEQAYDTLRETGSPSAHSWLPWSNCKNEASRLVDEMNALAAKSNAHGP